MIKELLKENMTKEAYELWEELDVMTPDIWNLPTSSTGKYPKKKDGSVPTNEEHTCEMLNAFVKIKRAFDKEDHDVMLMAIALHDCLRYGEEVGRHTSGTHDKIAGDFVSANYEKFLTVFDRFQFGRIENAVRIHSGRWSTDAPDGEHFDFDDYDKEVRRRSLIIHLLDMWSTASVLEECEAVDKGAQR